MKATTGIENLVNNREAIIFIDKKCPKCDGNLILQSKNLAGQNIKIRYECNKCSFICPVKHDINNNTQEPSYDSSIKDFIDGFGKE